MTHVYGSGDGRLTQKQFAARYGAPEHVIQKMKVSRLNAMTELGRDLLMAVTLRAPSHEAVLAATLRVAREAHAQTRLRNAEAAVRRRMSGTVQDLVWIGQAGEVAKRAEISLVPCDVTREENANVEKIMAASERVSRAIAERVRRVA